ncbi:hypothetical protein V1525DRAFT_401372 [Lipomyces kononenkoae]|uniref:Uncharacterized protein n=1 Tax=Lipomyces kononenkoae TaxID=34357 RepID=A0ACC3T4L7_LIPKO
MHRHTQSTSNLGKKAPPPPPKPKNPALRGSPTPPVGGQTSLPGAFPENNTETTRSGPPNFPARPIVSPRPPEAATTPVEQTAAVRDAWTAPQVDLELDKKWYAMGNNPIKLVQLPTFLSGLNYASTIAMSANTKTIVLCVRFADLARTKFRIEVDRYDDNNVSAQRIDYPPPARPGVEELEAAAAGFGENVAKFVETNVGRQVGDGECWTVAKEALTSSGAMPSCGLVHGVEIWSFAPGTGRGHHEGMLRRGDILQFKTARFRTVDASSAGRITGEKYVGAPDHTAVIVCVHGAGVVTVMEQNVGGVRTVQQGSYVFGDMVDGSVVAYRPFWQAWAGELETSWP